MEVLIKLSDAIKTLKSMAVPLVRKLPSAQPERLTDYSFEESCTECPAYDTENHRCPRFNQVIRTALKDANLEPCENCISRQAAIDVADAVWSVTGDKNVAKVWDQIKDLPSAQPEQRWIPCSERLPEQYGNYLISIHGEDEPDIGTINPNDKRGWSLCDANGFHWASDKKLIVTAWMPLPEPYKERREE